LECSEFSIKIGFNDKSLVLTTENGECLGHFFHATRIVTIVLKYCFIHNVMQGKIDKQPQQAEHS